METKFVISILVIAAYLTGCGGGKAKITSKELSAEETIQRASEPQGGASEIGLADSIGGIRTNCTLVANSKLDMDMNGRLTAHDAELFICMATGFTAQYCVQRAHPQARIHAYPWALQLIWDQRRSSLDLDGNSAVDALTDGVIFARYLSGGGALSGAIAPNASRNTDAVLRSYIESIGICRR
jgi:hypothetical protein